MAGIDYRKQFAKGELNYIDDIANGDAKLANAIHVYENIYDGQTLSIHWQRAMRWVENILFTNGRHYLDDILVNSLSRSSDGDLSVIRDAARQVPKPTNDLLGRYIETNVALLTENRPRPRVQAKSDKAEDQSAAELSELTLEYLWEALDMPHLHRQIARLLLVCGVCWLEICYDPTKPRRITVPETELKKLQIQPPGVPGAPPVPVPIPQRIPKKDQFGQTVFTEEVEYGDLTAKIVSPFEMYMPPVHSWGSDELGWVMREFYMSKAALIDQYRPGKGLRLNKSDGWYLDNLDKVGNDQVNHLPIWWWERLSQTIEGGGTTFYAGSPDLWKDHVIVRIFDRKPNAKWPRGRTVITAGGQVIYDSPKKVGARAYDPRWPNRWHPYIIFRWEPTAATDIYCRSLVTKLLPSLKRINTIDTSFIMWRRTVPMASWVIPKGCFLPGTQVTDSKGFLTSIEHVTMSTGIQSMDSIQKVKHLAQYDNDELVNTIKAKGQLPITSTAGHHIPIISAEDVAKYRTKTWADNGKLANGNRKRNYTYSEVPYEVIQDTLAQNIKPGDYILTGFTREKIGDEKLDISKYHTKKENSSATYTAVPPYIQIDQGLLRLFGLYLAEGCVKKNNLVQFTVGIHEKETLAVEIKALIETYFGLNVTIREEHNTSGSRTQITCSSVVLADLLKALFNTGSKVKSIHPDLFTYPGSLLPLVGGLLDGDGCVTALAGKRTAKAANIRTISPNLASQIRGILLDEKIAVSISKNGKGRNNEIYALHLATLAQRSLHPYSNKLSIIDTAQKVADQGFWVGNLRAEKVKSNTQKTYVGPVYDLEIENKHYYQANGIIVHNTTVVEDQWSGGAGQMFEFDPRRTAQHKPEPVYPPPFPEAVLAERQMMLQQMEAIAGTEEILRGQRPAGVTSSAMLDTLRKQALASRSSIIQDWDESLQKEGTGLLMEVIKHVKKDARYAERIRILAREKTSRLAIADFSGTDLSDNVVVRVDTASLALSSKEAKEAKTIEFLRYVPALMSIPYIGLRQAVIEELGFSKALTPQGPDVERAKRLISWIKIGRFERVIPLIEDDPYIFYELLVKELKDDSFWDLDDQQRMILLKLIDSYKQQITQREEAQMKMQMLMAQMKPGSGGGEQQGG